MADAAASDVRQESQEVNTNVEDVGNAQGTTEQSTPNWESVDVGTIPEDLIKNSPLYKSLMTETVQRRQTIKNLRSELSDNSEDGSTDTETQESSSNSESEPDSEVARLRQAVEKLTQRIASEDEQSLRENVAERYALPSELREFIKGDNETDMNESAKTLSELLKKQGVGNASATNAQTTADERTNRFKQAIKDEKARNEDFSKAPSIFDMGTQRNLGGGVVGLPG